MEQAIVTVFGKDRRGIVANISKMISEFDINILDITQKLIDGYFTMIMIVDISEANKSFAEVKKAFNERGLELGLEINIQTKEIIDNMYKL